MRAVKWAVPEHDYSWLVDEVNINLPRELDFGAEADNADRCRANFASKQCVPSSPPPATSATVPPSASAFLSQSAACLHVMLAPPLPSVRPGNLEMRAPPPGCPHTIWDRAGPASAGTFTSPRSTAAPARGA